MKPFVLFFIFSLVFVFGNADTNKTEAVYDYNKEFDILLNTDTVFFFKRARDAFKTMTIFGHEYAEVFAAGLEILIEKLDADYAAAFKLAYKHIISKLDYIEQHIKALQSFIPWNSLQISYDNNILVRTTNLMAQYRLAQDMQNVTTRTKLMINACSKDDPLEILNLYYDIVKIKKKKKNLTTLKEIEEIESKINFLYVSGYEKMQYDALKQKILVISLSKDHYVDVLKILKARPDGKMTFQESLKLYENVLYGFEFIYQETCWTKIAYVGVEQSRTGLFNFMDVIKLDILRLNHLSLICANVTHPNDPEAVANYLSHINNNVEKIASRMKKFAKSVLDKAYPNVIVEAAKKFLGPNPIPHSVYNETAEKIRKELDDRDVEEANYRIVLTDLITPNVESSYNCSDNQSCFDFVHTNNIRLFAFRYFGGLNYSDKLHKAVLQWNSIQSTFQACLDKNIPSNTLNILEQCFFREFVLQTWNVVMLHNKKQHYYDAHVFVGFDNVKYQGQSFLNEVSKEIDQIYPWNDHAYKILFIVA